MRFSKLFSAVLFSAVAFFPSLPAEVQPSPVWEWKAKDEQDRVFDGSRFLEFPEVRELYRAQEGFAVEVRLKPGDHRSSGGIVSDYENTKGRGWYVATGDERRPQRPVFVAIDRSPHPTGIRKLDADRSLRKGEWQTLLAVSDGTKVFLFLDGIEVGELELAQPLLPPAEGVFTIGRRNSRSNATSSPTYDYFEGEIEFVRLWDQPIAVNHISNSSFELGGKIEDILLWHRMAGTSAFVKTPNDWEIDDTTAYHGKRSLRGGDAEPLVLMEEVWEKVATKREIWSNASVKDPWVFSVYLKADKDGLPCELSVGAYWMLNEERVSEQVSLTTEWQRYELVVTGIPTLYRRYMDIQGPLNFIIEPRAPGTVWVDAVQWSKGEVAKAYSPDGPEHLFMAAPPLGVPEVEVRQRPEGGKSSWEGRVPIRVFREGSGETAGRQPVTVGVPFNRNSWDGRGIVSLRNEAGQPIEVQAEVITEWSGGQGVQMLGLFFTDDLAAGWQSYTMEIKSGSEEQTTTEMVGANTWEVKPPEMPGQLWQEITDTQGKVLFEAGSLRAIDIHGKGYDSRWDRNAEWKLERDGPLYRTYRGEGQLVDREGRGLLAYIARIHVWRDIPGVKLEVTLVNSRNDHSIRVRTLYWHAREGGENRLVTVVDGSSEQPAQGRFVATSLADVSPISYFVQRESPKGIVTTKGRVDLALKGKTGSRSILAHAPEAWQRNPVALAWEDGEWRGYFWPDSATRSLVFPRGLALTREFWLRETESEAEDLQAWDTSVFGMADSEWWASTDVMTSFSSMDLERFPFMEQKLSGEKLLGRIGPARVNAANAYGVFDYGDSPGDGGWSNLESFTDWTALLNGLRSEDETAIAIGLRSAQHYRDVDMNQATGATYMHNIGHHLGWFDMSHSWPDGVVMHYLLTGSKRSEEMILKHGEYLLTMNRGELERGLRTLGRYLMNLANIYQITGDDRYKKRFFDQVRSNEKLLENQPDNPDRSIFGDMRNWKNNRLEPYHAWYGIFAMQKMESLTGDPELTDLINREVAASLNPDLYAPTLEELWPGLPPEENMPLMVADFARHRGSFFYPVMTKYAEIHGDEQVAKLALDSLYAWGVEGRSSGIQGILGSAPLKFVQDGQTEEDLITAAADLMWNAAADTLLNGDFSLSDDYCHYWRPLPNKEISVGWQKFREKMVTLDPDVRKEGQRSLRFNFATDEVNSGFNRSISMDSSRFRLAPGKYVLKGWLRWDEGAMPPAIGMELRNLRGRFDTWTYQVGERGYKPIADEQYVKVEDVTIGSPDAEGWRKMEILLNVEKRSVANLLLTGKLKDGFKTGHLWIDDFRLEKR